jgi:hypothetical protein
MQVFLQRNDLPNGLCGIKFAFQKPCLKMNFKYYFLKAFFSYSKGVFQNPNSILQYASKML